MVKTLRTLLFPFLDFDLTKVVMLTETQYPFFFSPGNLKITLYEILVLLF